MINRKEKIWWILYAAVLVLLFLLSSTDLIIKEQKHEVYRLSVIIEDSRDDNYVNFRKGMDQAALELNADVSFITMYEKDNAAQQVDLIVREQQDGAQALVVSPVDEQLLAEAAEEQIQVPLLLLNAEQTGGNITAVISPDYQQMGRQLAQAVMQRHDATIPVYLFGQPGRNRIAQQFEAGIRSEFEAEGREVTVFERLDERSFRQAIEELVYPGCKNVVILALDPASLEEAASILADSSVYDSYVEGLYGRGTTLSVLNAMDRGLIRGICVTDDFAAGYQSVQLAVELVKSRGRQQGKIVQESYYIEQEDLRSPEFEKMLYPIE